MFHGISALLLVWFFPTSVFGVGIFFLIAPFPDLCLLVPFNLKIVHVLMTHQGIKDITMRSMIGELDPFFQNCLIPTGNPAAPSTLGSSKKECAFQRKCRSFR